MKNYNKPELIEEVVIVEDVIAASSGTVKVSDSVDYTDNNVWKF